MSTTNQGAAGIPSRPHQTGFMQDMILCCLYFGSSKKFWYVYSTITFFFLIIPDFCLQETHNIDLSETAQRWLQHHSVLGPDDAVLIGISSVSQLEPTLRNW